MRHGPRIGSRSRISLLLALLPGPCFGTPSLIQHAVGTASAASSVTATFGSTPTSGNFEYLAVTGTLIAQTVSSITQTGATWTLAKQQLGSSVGDVEIWKAPVTSSSFGKAVQVNMTSTDTALNLVTAEFSGAWSTTDGTGGVPGSSTSSSPLTASSGSATNTGTNDLVIAALGCFGTSPSWSGAPTSSFSVIASENVCEMCYRSVSSNATYSTTDTATFVGSATPNGAIAAFGTASAPSSHSQLPLTGAGILLSSVSRSTVGRATPHHRSRLSVPTRPAS